jgi:hypothetical protein
VTVSPFTEHVDLQHLLIIEQPLQRFPCVEFGITLSVRRELDSPQEPEPRTDTIVGNGGIAIASPTEALIVVHRVIGRGTPPGEQADHHGAGQ